MPLTTTGKLRTNTCQRNGSLLVSRDHHAGMKVVYQLSTASLSYVVMTGEWPTTVLWPSTSSPTWPRPMNFDATCSPLSSSLSVMQRTVEWRCPQQRRVCCCSTLPSYTRGWDCPVTVHYSPSMSHSTQLHQSSQAKEILEKLYSVCDSLGERNNVNNI